MRFIIIGMLCIFVSNNAFALEDDKFGAFIRFKNEIEVLPAMLDSIDGVFDHIVMIYSIEKDDGSIKYATKWCEDRKNCEIYGYPYVVNQVAFKKGDLPKEYSLEAYYNFGLQFFDDDEYVVKIDADQIYITENLRKIFSKIKSEKDNIKTMYGIMGYNTFVWKSNLYLFSPIPYNGMPFDHFIVKKENIKTFLNSLFWETIAVDRTEMKYHSFDEICWFHFKNDDKTHTGVKDISEIAEKFKKLLTVDQASEFEKYIRPLLIKHNSEYKDLKILIEDSKNN